MLHRSAIAVAISSQYVLEVLGPRESVGAAAAAMEIAIAIDRPRSTRGRCVWGGSGRVV